jgi:signal transduction histidine kinase/CheY-like chemotaxis protein
LRSAARQRPIGAPPPVDSVLQPQHHLAGGRPDGAFRRSLFRRYAQVLALLVSVAVLASGAVGALFAYRDARALVDELQREKARAAAARIEQFIHSVELQMRSAVVAARAGIPADAESRKTELLRLLRMSPSISDAAALDAAGHERVRVSRVSRDIADSDIDRSAEPAVAALRAGQAVGYGGIVFRRQSEPHLPMAVVGSRPGDGVVVAEINLKFASDVIAGIAGGGQRTAYVVDSRGGLIAHAESGLALRLTNLAHLPQVHAALSLPASAAGDQPTVIASVEGHPPTISAHASIAPLGWHVFVEQPLAVAFAPLRDAAVRTALLLLAGVGLAVVASSVLARRMAAPIRQLEAVALRISEGRLEERVDIRTGDELQALGEQFNRMASKLSESQAGLEEKVAERTRQLEAANRGKARFLAAASHDLRQPAHALGLFVAQLQASRDPAAGAQLIDKIAACSAAVGELIEALLDISKLDAGVVTPQPAAFALQPLFDRIEQAFSMAAQDQGLRLRVRATPVWVHTDPVLLDRILLNLCANAIRYTEHGGAILGARVRGKHVRIEVRDTGIGISAEQQRHIFDEFYQADRAAHPHAKGLGLGLAIVDRLARLLGLAVDVRSEPGRGSVFAVEVPLVTAAGGAREPPMLRSAGVEGLAVLLIDDDATARDALAGLLRQWGCEVSAVATAAEARASLDRAAPRLIICDYHLAAGELGTTVVQQLRAAAGHAPTAAILSADVTQPLRDAAAANGLHLWHKPLNAARLRVLLAQIAIGPTLMN